MSPVFDALREHLPSLYRPDAEDTDLFSLFLRSTAEVIEAGGIDATTVLQAHWFEYADFALYHPYAARFRALSIPPVPTPHPRDPSLQSFPYVHDLARLTALLALPPWQNPPELREWVEAYRRRIARIVALYRNGLGTLDALRSMVEAQLPPAAPAPTVEETPEERAARLENEDRAFSLEEYAPLVHHLTAVTAAGPPLELVGPLMRWTIANDGVAPAAPTLYIEGQTAVSGQVDATLNPVIELYRHRAGLPRVGIGFVGTVAPGETLALRPVYSSWLGTDTDVQQATSASGNPTVPGVWAATAGAPTDCAVPAFVQVRDRGLWLAANTGDPLAGELWRFDGQAWMQAVTGLPEIFCMIEDGDSLLIGTEDGMKRLHLYPEDGIFAMADEGAPGQPVFAVHRAGDGVLWIGTDNGARPLGDPEPRLAGTNIFAIAHEPDGTLYFGGSLGVFLYQPGLDTFYYYAGEVGSETEEDWRLLGETPPDETQVFLPAVRAVFPAPDASLWLGTDRGFARYVARPQGRSLPAYTTQLEAFPDVADGRVYCIEQDERGWIWFGTDRGVLRYDGRDLWHYAGDTWRRLGHADLLYGDRLKPETRGAWRFQRATSQWQRFNIRTGFSNFTETVRTSAEPGVRAVAWTDGVVGEVGAWDGTTFTAASAVDPAQLVMRFKPSALQVRNGGIPAIPRLPPGSSTWRYLSLEPETAPALASLPAWTVEGRLIPPPADWAAPPPGRYDKPTPPPPAYFDESVFAYNPAARVWFEWNGRRALTVLVRLQRRVPDEAIDPAILERVRQGIETVRAAGVEVVLVVEEELLGGS